MYFCRQVLRSLVALENQKNCLRGTAGFMNQKSQSQYLTFALCNFLFIAVIYLWQQITELLSSCQQSDNKTTVAPAAFTKASMVFFTRRARA
jgi:hypothetical protein